MSNSTSNILKGKPHPRRQVLKLALFAGPTLAVGVSPVLADDSTSVPPTLPEVTPGTQGLVKPNSVSATTPRTSYKLYSGLDFSPFSSDISY